MFDSYRRSGNQKICLYAKFARCISILCVNLVLVDNFRPFLFYKSSASENFYLFSLKNSGKWLLNCLWQYHPKWKQPKWKFSTFFGLPRSTTYPYLPQGRIDPLEPHSYYPQGGVQIYPMANLLYKK